jgi:hypothetical protein
MGMRVDDGFHRARRSRLLCLRVFSMGIYFRFTVVRWFFIFSRYAKKTEKMPRLPKKAFSESFGFAHNRPLCQQHTTPPAPAHAEANMSPPPYPTRLITSTAALPFLCIAAQVKSSSVTPPESACAFCRFCPTHLLLGTLPMLC